jgi:bacterioferritin
VGYFFPVALIQLKKRNVMTETIDKTAVINQLNKILEFELAGVVRYTHYSLMVFGYNRIPIIGWMEEQAVESLSHAKQAGELITRLGGHPSLAIGPFLEPLASFKRVSSIQ